MKGKDLDGKYRCDHPKVSVIYSDCLRTADRIFFLAKIRRLAREIEKQETLISEYDEKIQAAATDYTELSRLMEEKTAEDQMLAELYARWEALSGELEA